MSLNLTRQLTVILAVCIFLTASAAILPTYLYIRGELEQETQRRLEDARHNSQIVLGLESTQLERIVTLAAQRPTLERLLRERKRGEMQTYLRDFQRNTPLDYLYVTDLSGVFLAGTPATDDALALSSTTPVSDVGFVTGQIRLDAEFAARLQQQTGFSYNFSPTAIDAHPFQQTIDGTRYYGDVLPLHDLTGNPSAIMVVLVPVGGLLAAEGQFIGLVFLTTLAVSAGAALAGGLYIRSRIRLLWKLTAAARGMGQGDLSTPIQTTSTTLEIKTLADVLERSRVQLRRTLQELSQSKQWAESLIQSIVEGIITLDSEGTILFFSEGAARITNLPPEQAIGQHINTIFKVTDESDFSDYLPPESGQRNVAVRTAHGQRATIAITRARQSEDGQTTIVLHDVTEETQRRSLQTYFLAHVSHELRTPLAGMKVSIELLLENARYLSTAELNELLNSLYLSVSSLQNLIDNLLESSKIEANHLALRPKPVAFNPVLSDALRVVQPFLKRRQQTLRLDEPLTLPALKADSTRLTQVLVNLLSNASKYSPMSATIDILADVRPGAVYVAIADRGQGIPEQQRDRVFRQFVRLDSEARSDYGAGLGLAVVKAIIEAHGGQVGVEAREGGGSVFWFTLPSEEIERHESVSD